MLLLGFCGSARGTFALTHALSSCAAIWVSAGLCPCSLSSVTSEGQEVAEGQGTQGLVYGHSPPRTPGATSISLPGPAFPGVLTLKL